MNGKKTHRAFVRTSNVLIPPKPFDRSGSLAAFRFFLNSSSINSTVVRNGSTLYPVPCTLYPVPCTLYQVRWTYQPGSHRRKVTQDFSSPFLLRSVRALIFLARRIQPFLSFVDGEVELIVLLSVGIFIFIFYYLVRKIPFTGTELTSQRARRLRGYL